jgi:BatD DUF11 like domain
MSRKPPSYLLAAAFLAGAPAALAQSGPAVPPLPQDAAPALPAPATATGPVLSASLSARTIAPGQQVVLSYRITGARTIPQDYTRSITVPGLNITFSGLVIKGGGQGSDASLRYMVQAEAPGEYTIPAQTMTVDGLTLETEALKLTVAGDGPAKPPVDASLLPNVQLTLGKTEFWKGEIVPVSVAILVHQAIQPLSPFFPQLKTPNFAVNRFDRSAGLEAREINGVVWRAYQMESIFTALKSGTQQLGPAEIKAELLMPLPGEANDPFGRQRGNRVTETLTSNTIEVHVRELPEEGKPASFNGAVGNFEIEVLASPVVLNAGDPIAVEISLNGTGNFDALTSPRLETTDGWRQYEPRVTLENRAWGTEPGRKSFTQILIPEKNLTEIPPFVLSYFDPQTGTYVTRKSTPVALKVNGEFKAAANPAAGSKDFDAPPNANVPTEELGDILGHPLTTNALVSTAAAAAPVHPLLLHGVPALLLALVLGAGLKQRLRAAAEARRPEPGAPRPPAAVLSDLRRDGASRQTFYSLVSEYITAFSYHRSQPPAVSEALTGLLHTRDRWLYGAADPAALQPVPADERRQALDVLRQL